MQHPSVRWLSMVSEFQSSSGQKAGCNPFKGLAANPFELLFQSSSGQKAGCNDRRSRCLVSILIAAPILY